MNSDIINLNKNEQNHKKTSIFDMDLSKIIIILKILVINGIAVGYFIYATIYFKKCMYFN